MSSTTTQLVVPRMGSRRMAELADRARSRGMTPQRYAKELIEEGLDLEREARSKSFDEILAPLRESAGKVDEGELDGLVDRARARHRVATRRKER